MMVNEVMSCLTLYSNPVVILTSGVAFCGGEENFNLEFSSGDFNLEFSSGDFNLEFSSEELQS